MKYLLFIFRNWLQSTRLKQQHYTVGSVPFPSLAPLSGEAKVMPAALCLAGLAESGARREPGWAAEWQCALVQAVYQFRAL